MSLNVNTAKDRVKRVIEKGEAAAEAVAGKLVISERQHQNESVESIHYSYTEMQFASSDSNDASDNDKLGKHKSVGILDGVHEHEPSCKEVTWSSDRMVSKFAVSSVLFLCAGVLHSLKTKGSKLSSFADISSPVPMYIVALIAVLSFFAGRIYEALNGNRKPSAIRHSKQVGLSTTMDDASEGKPQTDVESKQHAQPQHVYTYAHQFRKKLHSGKHKMTRYANKIQYGPSEFWSNLRLYELEEKIPSLVLSNDLMRHLLTYQDFGKSAASIGKKQGTAAAAAVASTVDSVKDVSLGQCILINSNDASFEDEGFDYIVDPICRLRGMDMFLTDDPEVEIWKQPMLIECGLRKTSTLIANLMLPFSNMTVYMKLPKWFDNWSNIPEERECDPPDVKAFKRFLSGDDEYRNSRTKLVPFIVDGPMAIRMIKPKPQEFNMHGWRHPVSWHKIDKSTDPKSGLASSALLECDIDLVSNPTIRKIVSMIRPHLPKITIDLALIVSKPKDSEVDEPSACIGMWRIDKVDFEKCGVFPEKNIEQVVEEVKSFIALEAQDERVRVAAG